MPTLRPSCSGSDWNPPYLFGCNGNQPPTYPVYENTTEVEPQCPSGNTSPHAVGKCAAGATPCSCNEFASNYCGPATDPQCARLNPYTPRYLNTYALKIPLEYAAVGVCRLRGFKVVYAMKTWHGRRGFNDACSVGEPLTQTKYLTVTRYAKKTIDGQVVCNDPVSQRVYERTVSATVGRTGGSIVRSCSGDARQSVNFISAEHCGADQNAGWTCGEEFFIGQHHLDYYLNMGHLEDECPELPCNWEIPIKSVTTTGTSSVIRLKIVHTDPRSGCGPGGGNSSRCAFELDGFTWTPCMSSYERACEQDKLACGGTCGDCEFPSQAQACANTCAHLKYDAFGVLRDACDPDFFPCGDKGEAQNTPLTTTYEVTITLSDPYTAAHVDDDCEALLSHWNLADDVQYPWRYDVPMISDGAFAPNYGPSYGPLVTYREPDQPVSPESQGCPCTAEEIELGCSNPEIWSDLYGRPINGSSSAKYEAWFNSEHEVMALSDCWRVTGWGASSPYPNATQWMPANVNNAFPAGAIAAYNSPYFQTQACNGQVGPLFVNRLIKSKYAEIYLHEFPSHNYARPCGADDRAAVNWDYLDCSEGHLRNALEWPRDARWPNSATPTTNIPNSNRGSDASCYCNRVQAEQTTVTNPPDAVTCRADSSANHCCESNVNVSAIEPVTSPPDLDGGNTPTKTAYPFNDTNKKGDYSIKSWRYQPLRRFQALETNPSSTVGNLGSFSCSAGCAIRNPCRPSAIFFQKDAPTGKYADATHIPTVSIALRDEIYQSSYTGEASIQQLHQVMVDPLWQRPRLSCALGGGTDQDAEAPLEENRDCADGICDDYVAHLDSGVEVRPRCEPASIMPWQYVD